MFFKIIIPVFDSEYIEKCIMSIENQTFKDFVIIAINDHCTDNTFKKVKTLAQKYNNIVCIEPKEKLYIGGARNMGIHYDIKSQYTLFIDNDDWLKAPTVFQELNNCIINNNYPDCVRLSYECVNKEEVITVMLDQDTPEKLVKSLYIAPWTKCIKSEIIVDFPGNTLVEDIVQHIAQCDVLNTVVPFNQLAIVWNRNNPKAASLKQNQKTLLNGKRISSIFRNMADLLDLRCIHDYCEEERQNRIQNSKEKIIETMESL